MRDSFYMPYPFPVAQPTATASKHWRIATRILLIERNWIVLVSKIRAHANIVKLWLQGGVYFAFWGSCIPRGCTSPLYQSRWWSSSSRWRRWLLWVNSVHAGGDLSTSETPTAAKSSSGRPSWRLCRWSWTSSSPNTTESTSNGALAFLQQLMYRVVQKSLKSYLFIIRL